MGGFNFRERIRRFRSWKIYKVQVKIKVNSTGKTLAYRDVEASGRDRHEAASNAIKLFKTDIVIEATDSQLIKK